MLSDFPLTAYKSGNTKFPPESNPTRHTADETILWYNYHYHSQSSLHTKATANCIPRTPHFTTRTIRLRLFCCGGGKRRRRPPVTAVTGTAGTRRAAIRPEARANEAAGSSSDVSAKSPQAKIPDHSHSAGRSHRLLFHRHYGVPRHRHEGVSGEAAL